VQNCAELLTIKIAAFAGDTRISSHSTRNRFFNRPSARDVSDDAAPQLHYQAAKLVPLANWRQVTVTEYNDCELAFQCV
jgi:hypothetical protein